jgi:hypothetical protein
MNAARITRFEAAMMSPSLSTHRTASQTTGSQSGAYSVWLETWLNSPDVYSPVGNGQVSPPNPNDAEALKERTRAYPAQLGRNAEQEG